LSPVADSIRIDKWLWHARFYRTRTLAQSAASTGLIRLNGHRVTKPSASVGPNDVLTLPKGSAVIVVRVLRVSIRRGSAPNARLLYEIVPETSA
jgi:ribosome-associated heat shock protein Hsp15